MVQTIFSQVREWSAPPRSRFFRYNHLVTGVAVLFAAWAATSDRLVWTAPEGCPTHDEVARALDREDTSAAESEIDTTATVIANASGKWTVVIVVRSTTGEIRRELELDSCAAAAEAVALVHALAVSRQEPAGPTTDPDPPTPELVPTPPTDPSPVATSTDSAPATATTPARARTRDAPPPPRRPPPALVLDLAGGGGIGSLPRGGGHVMLGFGAQWRWIRLDARIDHAIVRRSVVDDTDVGTNISTTTGGLALHIPIALGPITLLPGVDVRAGGMRARGIGGAARVTRWVPWALAGLGVDLVWMASRVVGVRVGAAVEVPLARHRFTFDSLETAQTRRVGALLLAGLEIRFPQASR